MKHVIAHDLDEETARMATRKAFEAYAERFADYSPTARWIDENNAEIGFRAKGIKLAGSVELRPGHIDLELDVPFLLRPLRGRAIAIIEREIRKWVDKAHSGELS